jgi:hypothetical protein
LMPAGAEEERRHAISVGLSPAGFGATTATLQRIDNELTTTRGSFARLTDPSAAGHFPSPSPSPSCVAQPRLHDEAAPRAARTAPARLEEPHGHEPKYVSSFRCPSPHFGWFASNGEVEENRKIPNDDPDRCTDVRIPCPDRSDVLQRVGR